MEKKRITIFQNQIKMKINYIQLHSPIIKSAENYNQISTMQLKLHVPLHKMGVVYKHLQIK